VTPDKFTILIVDDHPLFRFGLRTMLQAQADMQPIGEASTGYEAVTQAVTLRPSIVVMDLNLPGLNGIEATRRIAQIDPTIAVLVLTMFQDDESIFAAMRAGARGYLLKGAAQDDIIRAIRGVGLGEAIFGPSIAQRVMQFLGQPHQGGQPDAFPELTAREREILELIARGQTNPGIARTLVISPKTVRNHVSNIFAKLHVADRTQAIMRAQQAGFGGTSRAGD
jgi:DNA-binding NarL/FixJ family response regulator